VTPTPIALIVPTRGRPHNAQALIDAHKATTDGLSTLYFYVDDNDPCAPEYLALDAHVTVGPPARLTEWTNRAAMELSLTHRVLGSIGDDHRPETLGWEKAILHAVDISTGHAAIVWGDDGLQGPNLPTAFFVTSNIVRHLGWMALPSCEHLYIDNAWKVLADRSGRGHYLPDVKIIHYHPAAGKAPNDATYALGNSNERYSADQAAFADWLENGADADVRKVKGTGLVTLGFLHPGEVAAVFSESKLDLFMHDTFGCQRLISHAYGQLNQECGSGGLVSGRNTVTSNFHQKSEAEWLFFIDADMGFAQDTLDRLVASADPILRPVLGGLCFGQRREGVGSFYGSKYRVQPTIYEYHEDGEAVGFLPQFAYQRDAVVRAWGTGAACLLIHRSVVDRMCATYGPAWWDMIRHPKGVLLSEDFSFCVRLSSIDIALHIDTSIKTTHYKHGVFLDEELFDRQQAALPVE